jgi:type II secretory pathway component PulM
MQIAPSPRLGAMEYGLALILLASLVAVVVWRPLRSHDRAELKDQTRLEELRAAKEAKYREIRDAELDHRMGKLSREDWRSVDRELRGEAIEILRELDALEGSAPEERERAPR